MTSVDQRMQMLYTRAVKEHYSRRQVLRYGAMLGLSAAAMRQVLSAGAFAQDAPASPAAGGPVNVPIVGQDMSLEDIKAAIAAEGEVNIGNWTYQVNPNIITRFQDHIKAVYDVDIT